MSSVYFRLVEYIDRSRVPLAREPLESIASMLMAWPFYNLGILLNYWFFPAASRIVFLLHWVIGISLSAFFRTIIDGWYQEKIEQICTQSKNNQGPKALLLYDPLQDGFHMGSWKDRLIAPIVGHLRLWQVRHLAQGLFSRGYQVQVLFPRWDQLFDPQIFSDIADQSIQFLVIGCHGSPRKLFWSDPAKPRTYCSPTSWENTSFITNLRRCMRPDGHIFLSSCSTGGSALNHEALQFEDNVAKQWARWFTGATVHAPKWPISTAVLGEDSLGSPVVQFLDGRESIETIQERVPLLPERNP